MCRKYMVGVPLNIVRESVLPLHWRPMMLSELRCGTEIDHLKVLNMVRYLRYTTRSDLPLCVHMKIHYELLRYLFGQSYTPCNFHLHWASLPLICGIGHPYKHMITLLYQFFMPISSLLEKMHTDFKVRDHVPTKVKCIDMENTILALRLNASAYLPGVQATMDAVSVATRNGAPTYMQATAKQLLLGLQVLLK